MLDSDTYTQITNDYKIALLLKSISYMYALHMNGSRNNTHYAFR